LAAGLLLLLQALVSPRDRQNEAAASALGEVDWVTIFFFAGLFVLVGAVQKAGLIDLMAKQLLAATRGDPKLTALTLLWGSAVLSAFVDNIPFVAAMIPLIKTLAPNFGGDAGVVPLWWSLALGACLGGNGTLVGAAANLTVAGLAERNGVPFRFGTFTAMAFPQMLLSILICHFYILWRFF
jgi:Na+/H+ antiporter NhaD/arsenite permease-like protein